MAFVASNIPAETRRQVAEELATRLQHATGYKREWFYSAWVWATNWALCVGRDDLVAIDIVGMPVSEKQAAVTRVWTTLTSMEIQRNAFKLVDRLVTEGGTQCSEVAITLARTWAMHRIPRFQEF